MVQIDFINTKEKYSISISFFPCIIYEKQRVKSKNYYNLAFIFLNFGLQFTWEINNNINN